MFNRLLQRHPAVFAVAMIAAIPLAAQELRLRIPGIAQKSEGRQPHAEITQVQLSVSMNLQTGLVYRNLNVQGLLHIPEGIDVVGISHRVQVSQLTDAHGADLLAEWRRGPQAFFEGQRYYAAVADFRDNNEPYSPMPIMAMVNNLTHVPETFAQVRGMAWLLVATRRVERDISPVEPGRLIELTPSLALRITRAHRDGDTLELAMDYEAEESDPFFNPNIPPPIIDAVTLIDDLGRPARRTRWSVQRQAGNGVLFTGHAQAHFELPEGRKPLHLRLRVVTDVEERRVEFSAENVKLPIEAVQ